MNDAGKIYGMDEYEFSFLFGSNLFSPTGNGYLSTSWYWGSKTYVPLNTSERKKVFLYPSVVSGEIKKNNVDLEKAKTVYVHPSCKIPRTLLTQKYKKALDPWLADVVVIPETCGSSSYDNGLIFVNDDKNSIYFVDVTSADAEKKNFFSTLQLGTKLEDVMVGLALDPQKLRDGNEDKDIDSLLKSEFQYYGYLAQLYPNQSWKIDYADNIIPKSKIVFEEDILAALKSENNRPDYESLMSAHEMLESKDESVQCAALKALAAMDYINYPNSFIALFRGTNKDWRNCSAWTNTDVKYMVNHFDMRGWSLPVFTDTYITQEDYDIASKLIPKLLPKVRIENLPFMYADQEYTIHPRLKK